MLSPVSSQSGAAPVLSLDAAIPEGSPQGWVPKRECEAARCKSCGLQSRKGQQRRYPKALPQRRCVPAAELDLLCCRGHREDGCLHSPCFTLSQSHLGHNHIWVHPQTPWQGYMNWKDLLNITLQAES